MKIHWKLGVKTLWDSICKDLFTTDSTASIFYLLRFLKMARNFNFRD